MAYQGLIVIMDQRCRRVRDKPQWIASMTVRLKLYFGGWSQTHPAAQRSSRSRIHVVEDAQSSPRPESASCTAPVAQLRSTISGLAH